MGKCAMLGLLDRATNGRLDAYQISLFLPENSLFFKIFSLFICVGNCSRSGCSTVVSCNEIGF